MYFSENWICLNYELKSVGSVDLGFQEAGDTQSQSVWTAGGHVSPGALQNPQGPGEMVSCLKMYLLLACNFIFGNLKIYFIIEIVECKSPKCFIWVDKENVN